MSAAGAKFLLDTSALFTLLEDEAGADRVAQVLKQAQTFISAVSLVEVRHITLQEQAASEADVRHALLKRCGASLVWNLDEPTVLKAAGFKAQHALSVADALIAATAQRLDAVLLHKDPEFDSLAGQIKQERLPLKSPGKAR